MLWYIRELSCYLREYLKYCFYCQIYQIKKYVSYEFLQSMLISNVSFHIITMNFILALFKSSQKFDTIMTISCKFFKRVTIIVEKITWSIKNWDTILLNRLNIVDWELSKIIIFDRDRIFFLDMWNAIFKKLNVKFLYFIIYHSQTNN